MKYPFYNPDKINIQIPIGKRVVLVGGCFNILHPGHIKFLKEAHETGDHLIIALEPDERITKDKKRTPIHKQEERAYILSALKYVDNIIMLPLLNGFNDYFDLVKTIKPHVIAITADDPQLENKKKQADSINAQLIIVTPRIQPYSSSAIYRQLIE
jgi:cytidyltransferase-like protein